MMRDFVMRYGNALPWLSFFGVILIAWAALFAMQPSALESEYLRLYGNDFWAALCAPLTGQSAYLTIFLMWGLMSAAMMMPTFAPTLKTYRDLTHTEAASGQTFAALIATYLVVWLGFSALAALVQLHLARADLLGSDGASISLGLTATLLLIAGGYQFTPLKEACLSKCRAPLTFFMQHWTPGMRGAAIMGLKLGLVCLGCCWALMSLGFVGGVMNLIWMGVATVLMVVEKLPQFGRVVTRPLGFVLVAAGLGTAVQAVVGI